MLEVRQLHLAALKRMDGVVPSLLADSLTEPFAHQLLIVREINSVCRCPGVNRVAQADSEHAAPVDDEALELPFLWRRVFRHRKPPWPSGATPERLHPGERTSDRRPSPRASGDTKPRAGSRASSPPARQTIG